MKLILIRHGHTTGDAEDRYGGAYDDALSTEGEVQVAELAEELAEKGIEAVYCSDLLRARQTAEVVAARLAASVSPASGGLVGRDGEALTSPAVRKNARVDVAVVPGLRERDQYGALTGMVKAEARQKHPDLVALVKDRNNTLPGAESYDDAAARMAAAFAEVAAKKHGCVAAVWHGGGMRVLFREILKLGEIDGDCGDCCWVELERQGDGWKVKELRRLKLAT